MGLYRDIKFNKGTLNDRFGAVGTSTNGKFIQTEKGLGIDTGSSKYVTYNSQLLPENAFSFVVWFKGKPQDNNCRFVGVATTSGAGILLNGGRGLFYLGPSNYRYFSVQIKDDTPYCIIFTIPGSGQTDMSNSKMYINGVEDPIPGVAVTTGLQATRSGFIYAGSTDDTQTIISRIKVYDHVLSQAEVNAEQVEFLSAQPINKPKRGFIQNKPTDLSSQVNNTLEANVLSGTWATNFPYSTFVASGTDITSAICTGVNSRTYSDDLGSFALGDIYDVIFDLTLNSGAAPVVSFKNGNDGGASVSVSTQSVSGHNVIRLTVTLTSTDPRLVLANTSAANWSATNFSVRKVTGLLAAYNMVKNGNTLVDISGSGYNMPTIFNAVSDKNGIRFNGTSAYILSNTSTDSLPRTTFSVSARFKINAIGITNPIVTFGDIVGNQRIWSIYVNSSNYIVAQCGYIGEATLTSTIAVVVGGEYDVVIVSTGNGASDTFTMYINGVSNISGSATRLISGNTGKYVSIGASQNSGTIVAYGNNTIQDIRMYNRVLSTTEITQYHNQFVLPALVDDLSDAGADGITKTDAPMREWERVSGTWKIGENIISNTQLTAGAPNFSTNVGWNLSGATISGGIYTGTTSGLNYCTSNLTLTAGKRYKIEVNILTTTNNAKVYVGGKNTSVLPVGRSIVYVVMDTVSNQLVGFNDLVGTSDYLSITEAPQLETMTNGTKYLECVTAGMVAIPSSTAYGTWEFDVYKSTNATVCNICFIGQDKANYPTQYGGYRYIFEGLEDIYLDKINGVTASTLLKSAVSYITYGTWYRGKVTRSTAGVFTVLIKGGAFTPTAGYDGWTLVSVSGGTGTNPVTDNTYTTSNYFTVDLDAGDRIANIIIKDGIKI